MGSIILPTFVVFGLLLPELMKILRISAIFGRLLILGEVAVISFLGGIRLALIRLLFRWIQVLPILADQLSNLGKGQALALQILSHLCSEGKHGSLHYDKLGITKAQVLLLEKRT